MPYNIFGEHYERGCQCPGCRRMVTNRDYADGGVYSTLRDARAAMADWEVREGYHPNPRHPVGSRHTDPPARPPEVTSLRLTHNGPMWREVESGGPLDEAALRELDALITTVESGVSWAPRPTPPPPTAQELLLRDYPVADCRHNYSWRPRRWVPHGDGPAFYGLEIEIKCGDLRVMQHAARVIGDLGHLKNDSSIGGGFELVTHPMSYPWAMENFPWSLLPELESLGCRIEPSTNGIHTHVARSSFRGSPHMLRWLKFVYRNRAQVIRLARRRNDRYGSFTEAVQKGQIVHVKAEKARERASGAQQRYRDCPCYDHEVEYAAATRELEALMRGDTTRMNRYQAVNTLGLETLELRVFASTLGELEAKVALQFPASAVEYTRAIRAADVCQGAWRWSQYSAWLREHESEYPELVRANAHARMPAHPVATYTMSAQPRRGL